MRFIHYILFEAAKQLGKTVDFIVCTIAKGKWDRTRDHQLQADVDDQ